MAKGKFVASFFILVFKWYHIKITRDTLPPPPHFFLLEYKMKKEKKRKIVGLSVY